MQGRKILMGDYVEFNGKLYIVRSNSDGNPILQRFYTSTDEMLCEKVDNLEKIVLKIQAEVCRGH